jgi:hypothetical protein
VHEASSLIVVLGTVNGLECRDILIDCGAASCFVSEQWAKDHRLSIRRLRQALKVSLGDGVTEGTLIGMVSAAEVTTQRSTASCSLLVMKQLSHHIILGMPWLEAANVTINFQRKEWNGKRLIDLSVPQQGAGILGSSGRAVLSAVKVGSEHGERVEAILRSYPSAFRTDLLRRSTVSLERAIKCKISLKDPQCRPTVDGCDASIFVTVCFTSLAISRDILLWFCVWTLAVDCAHFVSHIWPHCGAEILRQQ